MVCVNWIFISGIIGIGEISDYIINSCQKINPRTFNSFRGSFPNLIKGSLLRYIAIGSTQLIIFSLWEFTQNDSPAMVVLTVLFVLLLLGCWDGHISML